MDLVDGKTMLDYFHSKSGFTEDDVAGVIRQLCECLADIHSKNVVHLDLRPTNIRFEGRNLKLLDYNSARHLANKKSGGVVDIIGDTEFCAPEMLSFDPVLPASDMWSVAVIAYILLSGISPYYHEDEKKVKLDISDDLVETDKRLLGEEEEEYVEASFVFRTFEEEEFISPDEDSDEE